MVYVISQNGQPLMPTENHVKVRILLKNKKAKVIKRCPFTIQLAYDSTNYTQNITLGVDSGSNISVFRQLQGIKCYSNLMWNYETI